MGHETQYIKFDDINQCAASAATTFAVKGWKWAMVGVPTEADIRKTLEMLGRESTKSGHRIETGRLAVCGSEYWHEV